jgi:tetratricopeptide (TPR) repeat protein
MDIFMHFCAPRTGILLLSASLFIAGIHLYAQSGASKSDTKGVTANDAKIYGEAMVWFKKAEAMIGTPKEYSDEQAELFLKALQIKPDFLEAHYNLGLIYSHRKEMKQAAAEFEQVMKIDPQFDSDIHLLLASTYHELKDDKAAMSALEAGLQRHPQDLKLLRPLASLQFHNNHNVEAILNLQQILEIDPTDVSLRMDLALLFQKSGNLEMAIDHYTKILRMEPKNFAAHYNLGLIYLQQKKMTEAALELDTANQIQPGDAELLERLGDLYVFEKQHDKAAATYKAALETATDKSILYGKLGFSLANLNQPEAAVAALQNSTHLDSKIPGTYSLLGDLYADLKRESEAIVAYRKSLELNPKQKEIHYNLGTLYAEQKKLDEALAELKIATQLDPDYAAAWVNLALVAEKLNVDKDAIQAHEKVIALGKAQPSTYFHLGVLYAKTDQPDLSIASFTRAIELEPDKYRALLKDELKKVHSVLDSVRYQEKFIRLLALPSPK